MYVRDVIHSRPAPTITAYVVTSRRRFPMLIQDFTVGELGFARRARHGRILPIATFQNRLLRFNSPPISEGEGVLWGLRLRLDELIQCMLCSSLANPCVHISSTQNRNLKLRPLELSDFSG